MPPSSLGFAMPSRRGLDDIPPSAPHTDALGMIARFKGYPALSMGALALAQQITRDSLGAAPQPPTPRWVRYTLATVGGLVRWADESGQPLTVSHVLAQETRSRYLHVAMRHAADTTRASYRCRLDVVAVHLLHTRIGRTRQIPIPRGSQASAGVTLRRP